jgi:hypothetical protein
MASLSLLRLAQGLPRFAEAIAVLVSTALAARLQSFRA